MAGTYTCRQGDTIDLACHQYYGRTKDVTEAVLASNPGAAALGPVLPMGLVLAMPVTSKKSARKLVSLYD